MQSVDCAIRDGRVVSTFTLTKLEITQLANYLTSWTKKGKVDSDLLLATNDLTNSEIEMYPQLYTGELRLRCFLTLPQEKTETKCSE